MLDDDDFGEGEVEDTGAVNLEGSLGLGQLNFTPKHM